MIKLRNVSRTFGTTRAVDDITLLLDKGEIFTLIGPSGSGKSTILRLINLLDFPTEGEVLIQGRSIGESTKDLLEVRRTMAMVLQKPVMLTTSVFNNIAIGLRYRNVPKDDIASRVQEVLNLVGLEGYESRLATTLSGGEAQRVAIARAMVTRPEILLLDEPTANLDPVSSDRIEELVKSINRKFGTTIILTTHDLAQGQRLADRMAVIIGGRIMQVGSPEEVFYHPVSPGVAQFVGVENLLSGIVTSQEEGLAEIMAGGDLRLVAVTAAALGTRVLACIRSEDILLQLADGTQTSARNRWQGNVRAIHTEGPVVRIRAHTGGQDLAVTITRRSCNEIGLGKGSQILLSVKASAVHIIPKPDRE